MSEANPADDIRHEIEATRADLADTVDALSAKLDVTAQAKAKANDVRATVSDTAAKAEPYRVQILAGVGVAVALLLVTRRRTRRSR
jgi:ElaB/YqjD/DUF883 family membrane-anchored ribosome-binding protein